MRMRWAGHVAHNVGEEKCIQILWWENLKERDWLGRTRYRGRYNIRVDLKEVQRSCRDWVPVA
jgi:hypothetical protein